MTMNRSGVLDRYHHQRPMEKAAPLRGDPNARASDADVRRLTGHSGPANAPGHHHVKYTQHGDHRQAGFHTGSANTSAVPRIPAGGPPLRPSHGNSSGAHFDGHDT
jgi:hypothetical protein